MIAGHIPSERAYLDEKRIHPLGEGLLLDVHALLLQVLDAPSLELVEGVPLALHGGGHGGGWPSLRGRGKWSSMWVSQWREGRHRRLMLHTKQIPIRLTLINN